MSRIVCVEPVVTPTTKYVHETYVCSSVQTQQRNHQRSSKTPKPSAQLFQPNQNHIARTELENALFSLSGSFQLAASLLTVSPCVEICELHRSSTVTIAAGNLLTITERSMR